MLFFTIESIENTKKTLFKYREGGRTVGAGRVATIFVEGIQIPYNLQKVKIDSKVCEMIQY